MRDFKFSNTAFEMNILITTFSDPTLQLNQQNIFDDFSGVKSKGPKFGPLDF